MSTGVGTLQKPSRRSLWPAAVVLSFVMLTVAVVVFSIDRGGSSTQAPAKQVAVEAAAEAPADTPSELGGAITVHRGHVPRPGDGANAGTQPSEAMGTNTPSEISGGLPLPTPDEIRARELRRP